MTHAPIVDDGAKWRDLTQRHGDRLTLAHRAECGLRAELALPPA